MAYKKLLPPLQGKNVNWSASSQPGFTSPDMLNVRPRSVLNQKAVIGQRPAIVKAYSTQLGSGSPVVAMAQVSISNETNPTKYARKLVAASGNKIYYENGSNVMTELSGATIDTSEPVVMIEAFQKVFVVNGTNLKVIDFVNTELTLTAEASIATRNEILSQIDTATAVMVVDFANADGTKIYGKVTSTHLFDAVGTVTSPGTMPDFAPSAVSTLGVPLWYDWTVYPDLDLASPTNSDYGTMPTQATVAALFRGRAFLSGNKDYAHQWYGSRQSNPWDWLYYANDAQSPVAGNDANAGELGDPVTALIAMSDNYFLMSGASSIWVLSGDPTSGTLRQLTWGTGIWSRESWCRDDRNNIYFLANDGIYMITQNLEGPINISRGVLPTLMDDLALNLLTHRVTLGYDPRRQGLIICKTTIATGANESYWFDLRVGDGSILGGFFPESYPAACGIFSTISYEADNPTYNKILVGCFDGYIRTFDDDTKDDMAAVATAISSHCLFGPVPITDNIDFKRKLVSERFVTAGGGAGGTESDTDGITYQLFVADNAASIIEQVEASSPDPKYSGTITGPGLSRRKNHRASCLYAGVRVKNETIAQTWAIDRILLEHKKAGRAR